MEAVVSNKQNFTFSLLREFQEHALMGNVWNHTLQLQTDDAGWGKTATAQAVLQHLIMKRLQGPNDGYCVLHCEMANFFFKGQRVGMFSSTRDCRKRRRNGIFPSAYSVTPSCAVKMGIFDLATSYTKCQRSCQPCWFDIWHKESCLFRSEFTNFQLPS